MHGYLSFMNLVYASRAGERWRPKRSFQSSFRSQLRRFFDYGVVGRICSILHGSTFCHSVVTDCESYRSGPSIWADSDLHCRLGSDDTTITEKSFERG